MKPSHSRDSAWFRLGDRLQSKQVRIISLTLGLLFYLIFAYRKAWLSDDAFISLRSVSNVLDGYGLRWNVDERVQSFTHPLWMFTLIGAHAITGEPFYSTMYLSLIVSGAAVATLLFVCPGGVPNKLLALTLLMLSNAFVDFSSSGLENPLTHLLVFAFVAALTRSNSGLTAMTVACWIAGCAALNRLDTILIFAPSLAVIALRAARQHALTRVIVAFTPLALWEVFSVLYYGFPFPNTAYAKLAQVQVGAPISEGVAYLYSSILKDPLTLAAIVGCHGLAIARRDYKRLGLLAGAAIYLVYVIRIGGDFMAGRFLSAPLCVCAACLATSGWLSSRQALLGFIGIVASSCFGYWSTPWSKEEESPRPIANYIDQFGIHDERRIFFPMNSLVRASEMNPLMRDHPWSGAGFNMRDSAASMQSKLVLLVDAIGHSGYFAGPRVHLVDRWALADGLIARLPAAFGKYGHFPRVIPDGYIETLATDRIRIADAYLAEYYRRLRLVISGPLWDPERLKTIWQFNTGVFEPLRDHYAYARGNDVSVRLGFTNTSAHPCVTTYVWDNFRTSTYQLGCESQPGNRYEIEWHIDASGAELRLPADAVRIASFAGLGQKGVFTVSVAFSDLAGGPIQTLHELRYTYSRENLGLVVQRHPWPTWIDDFPLGAWHDGRFPGVLEPELTR
jgi:arabinofuranosyltransferase